MTTAAAAPETQEATPERAEFCHIALRPSKKIALCGAVIAPEPWCCDGDPYCGRPRCPACEGEA